MATRHYIFGKKAFIVVFTLFCLAAVNAAAWADDPNPKVAAHQEQKVILEKKALGQVVDTLYKRYIVNRATMIIGTDGRQTTLGDLRVPCDATIKFVSPDKGDPTALRIKVLEEHPGASRQMGG